MALRGISSASQHSLYPNTNSVRIENKKLPHRALEGSHFLSELLQDSLLLQACLMWNWVNIFPSPECSLCCLFQLQEDDFGHGCKLFADQDAFLLSCMLINKQLASTNCSEVL